MGIKWEQADLANPSNDLCTKINGVYVDVVGSLNGQWHCLWGTTQRFGPFATRSLAVAWFDGALSDLRNGRMPANAPN